MIFVFYVGFKFLSAVLPGLVLIFFQLLPFIIILYFVNALIKARKLHGHTVARGGDHTQFVELLVLCLIHMVKADGKIDPRELQVIRQFFQVNMGFVGIQMDWINDLINRHLSNPVPLDVVTQELNSKFNYESRLILLQLLYRVAFSDNDYDSSEKALLERIVSSLGIRDEDVKRIEAFFRPTKSRSRHWEVLGIKEGASKDEIKSAYRRLSKENHPDKVHHLGPEFQRVAQEKMSKINDAYNVLIKEAK
jgi:DnaJ like chaperone protein